MRRAVLAGTPGTPSSSACEAPTTRSNEPKCCSNARRRAGPTPSSWSNIDSLAEASRRWRWNVSRSDPLRERDHGDARQVELVHRGQRCAQLPLTAVDHDEIRSRRERLVPLLRPWIGAEPREAARDHLVHRGEVVLPLDVANRELAVVALLRDAILEHDHRADDLLSLDVRDVEALDPDRQRLEVQRLAQLLECLDASRALRLGDERLRLERQLRVLLRELLQPALLAPLRHAHLDARATALRQELLQRACVARPLRDEDLRRDRRRRAVVLEAELLQHLVQIL